MNNKIKFIIENVVPENALFDANSIIAYIKENSLDAYASFKKPSWNDAKYHQEMSNIITSYENSLITYKGDSWSMTTNHGFCTNKCWKKTASNVPIGLAQARFGNI